MIDKPTVFEVVNLKENSPPVELALVNMELAIERSKTAGQQIIKFIHGYGSGGVGGLICIEARKLLYKMKREKRIKDVLIGDEWDIGNEKTLKILMSCPSFSGDEDLNHRNPGITIVLL